MVSSQSNEKGSEDSQVPYRQQVIRALVQRYIESARREFEEAKRKGNAVVVKSEGQIGAREYFTHR